MSKSTKAVRRKEFAKSWWYSMYRHAREMSQSGKDNGAIDYCEMCCAANHDRIAPKIRNVALQAAFGTKGDKLQFWLVNQARW